MHNLVKGAKHLKPNTRRKLNWVLEKIEKGSRYRDVKGYKLHSHSDSIEWISIPLSLGERAIIAKNRHGEFSLLYVGTHAGYDKIVGPKMKKRLVNPWLSHA